ncbi:hypothetical protein [Parafrankia discariae]|nr:hypothetical protein [Parafrankia discariae]
MTIFADPRGGAGGPAWAGAAARRIPAGTAADASAGGRDAV